MPERCAMRRKISRAVRCCADEAIVTYAGERFFHLPKFLDLVECSLIEVLAGRCPADVREIAVYEWTLLQAAEDTEFKFRGLPIVD